MLAETITLSSIINKAWVVLVGLYWYNKKIQNEKDKLHDEKHSRQDALISDLQKLQIESKASFVTEAQMKEAVREALEPYKEDQQEFKLLLRGLNDNVISLSRDMAVANALRSTKNDQQNNVGE